MSATDDTKLDSNTRGWVEFSPPARRTLRMEMPDGRVVTDFTPKIAEHMTVYSRDNDIAGEVDEIEPDTKALKLGRDSNGRNHWIPMDLVVDVDANGVHLNRSLDEVRAQWADAPPSVTAS